MTKAFLPACISLVLSVGCWAQSARLSVQINKEWLQPGDTLEFAGTYEKEGVKMPPATLAVVLQQNDGPNKWQMRWPMIDGEAVGSIILPPGLPAGKYTLYTAVQPRFFRVYGRLFEPPGLKEIAVKIYDEEGGQMEINLPVEHGGFVVKDVLFENQATLIFSSKGKRPPVFSMEAWLDSAYTPVAATAKELGFGVPPNSISFQKISPDSARAKAAIFADPMYAFKALENSGLTPIQKFDSLYSSAKFKSGIDTLFNCLDNPEWQKARDIDEFLKAVLPDFQETDFNKFPVTANRKKDKYVLYLNEQFLYADLIANVALADIVLIKVFKPGFKPFAKSGDNNGGIAIYTRQGPFAQQNIYNPVRNLKGYNPLIYRLPLPKKE